MDICENPSPLSEEKKAEKKDVYGFWWGGYRCLLGGFLICLSFGSDFSFGNINTYLTSYMRLNGLNDGLRYSDFVFLTTTKTIIQGASMPFIGDLARRIGTRPSLIIGSAIYSGGYMLTYFTAQSYFPVAVITLAAHGLAFCFVYANVIGVAQSWFSPSKRGLVASIIVSGYGFGSSLWAPIQTFTANPNNLEANCIDPILLEHSNATRTMPLISISNKTGKFISSLDNCGQISNVTGSRSCERYFTDQTILDEVPSMFLILGIIYAVMEIIAVLLIFDPPTQHSEVSIDEDIVEQEKCKNKHINKNPDDFDGEDVIQKSMSPLQVLKSGKFYQLWFGFLSISLTNGIMGNYAKVFGLTFINDDHFYAIVAIFQNILNGLCRIGWGFAYDRLGYKTCFNIICIAETLIITTLPLLQYICDENLAKIVWGLYICLLYSTFPGIYVIIAAEVNKSFGPKYYQSNFGLLFTVSLAYSVIIILMSTVLFKALGYVGMFLVAGVFGIFGLLVSHIDVIFKKHI